MTRPPCPPPPYGFRPEFVPSRTNPSVANVTAEARSRLTAGDTFFRSIDQGEDRNDISLELGVSGPAVGSQIVALDVRFDGSLIETINVSQTVNASGDCTAGGVGDLRTAVNASSTLVEMPARGFDINDGGADASSGCVSAFGDTSMTGATGPSADPAFIEAIRTGAERALVIISTREDSTGFPATPSQGDKVLQFDGTDFIPYSNLVPGQCPKNS